MQKKLINIFSILIIIFMAFFIKIGVAQAATSWGSPVPVIRASDNKFINVQASLKAPITILKFFVYIDEEPQNYCDYCLRFGFIGTSDNISREVYTFEPIKLSEDNYNDFKTSGNDYILVYYNSNSGGMGVTNDAGKANETLYNEQFEKFNVNISSENWEGFYSFYDLANDKCTQNYEDIANLVGNADFEKVNLRVICDKEVHLGVKNYLQATGGIVLRTDTTTAMYDQDKNLYDYYNSLMKYKKEKIDTKISSYSVEDLVSSWSVLQTFIDAPNMDSNTLKLDTANDYDGRAYGPKYYQSTIDILSNLLSSDVEIVTDNLKKVLNGSSSSNDLYANTKYGNKPIIADSFKKWFYYAGRYLFDNDLQTFIKYYKYYYAPQIVAKEKKYMVFLEVLENTQDIESTVKSLDKIRQNRCMIYCPSCYTNNQIDNNDVTAANDKKLNAMDSQACNQCLLSNSTYKKCTDCEKKCEGVSGDANAQCMDGCIEGFSSKYKEVYEQIQSLQYEVVERSLDSLIKLSAPELDIKFDPDNGYKMNCDDVSVLHTIYLVIVIIAPILVIVLGSLDFTKAMIASDEKKISEFKSAFPKRIIMLVLLILIPIVIKFMIGVFSNLDSTLLDCIVNGS